MHSTHRNRLLLGATVLVALPYLFGASGGCGGQVSIGIADGGGAPGADTGTGPTPCPPGYSRDSGGNCCKPGECIGWVDAGPGADGGTITCTPEMCGPMPKSPSYTCPDGSIGGNTGKCIPMADGKCGWEHRECPPSTGACSTNKECAADSYCNDKTCGKAASPIPAGKCTKRPEGCPLIYAPVCGCDEKTYGNDCAAASAGVSVQYVGECKTTSSSCGGLAGIMCGKTEYCHYEIKDFCGGDDGMGTCKPRPDACPDIWSPVCGCDGKTYGNSCDANQQGWSVAYVGECKK